MRAWACPLAGLRGSGVAGRGRGDCETFEDEGSDVAARTPALTGLGPALLRVRPGDLRGLVASLAGTARGLGCLRLQLLRLGFTNSRHVGLLRFHEGGYWTWRGHWCGGAGWWGARRRGRRASPIHYGEAACSS